MRTHVTRFAIAALLAAGATAAPAKSPATAQLVTCDAGNCLLVRGHRASASAQVRINGRTIDPDGGRTWSVRVPVATLRSWSAPFARSIDVAVMDGTGTVEDSDTVRLPVGLLGHDVELASLVVRAH